MNQTVSLKRSGTVSALNALTGQVINIQRRIAGAMSSPAALWILAAAAMLIEAGAAGAVAGNDGLTSRITLGAAATSGLLAVWRIDQKSGGKSESRERKEVENV